MPRFRYDKDLEAVVEIRDSSNYFEEKADTPSVISDDLGTKGVFNHADMKTYDSKSRYYGAVKAAGCEIMGNDTRLRGGARKRSDDALSGLGRDIKDTLEKVRGEHPATMQGLMQDREIAARQDYYRRNR